MQGTEERIHGLKDVTDRTMGITQSGHRRENRLGKEKKKKKKNILRDLWDYNKRSNFHATPFLEGDKKEGGDEKVLEEIRAEKFLDLGET